ncbi:MAG: hypothetical protein IAF08_02585 [Rhizobacter sp.]|nr:hypothetical protein [Chlorobiales bacterium]
MAIACLLLLPLQTVSAQSSDRYTAAFLDIPLGARALALGGQYSPIDNADGTAFFWNPAGVAFTKDMTVTTMYSNQFGSLGNPLSAYFHIGYAQSLGKGTSIAVNWIRNSVTNIPLTDDPRDINGSINITDIFTRIKDGSLGNSGATFSNADDAVSVSIARVIASNFNFGWQYFSVPIELPIGVNFRYIRQGFSGNDVRVNFSGSGIGVDVGAMLKFKVGDFVANPNYGDFAFGFAAKDLFNTPIAWNTESRVKSSIYRSFIISISYQQPVTFIASTLTGLYTRNTKDAGLTSLGLEYRFRDLIALRVGSYDQAVTLGAGLFLFRAVVIDYAYQYSELGSPHRIGLTLNLTRLIQ